MSSARAVYQEPYEEIFNHDTSILPGATVTGFVQGNFKYSVADANNPGKGDYQETTMRVKLGIEFSNATSNSLTINGKYAFDQYQYMKSSIVSLDPVKYKTTIRGTGDNGYVFSVSKNGKGLKLVMKLQAKLDTTVDDEVNMDNLDSMYSTYKFTIDIYDNDNVKQEQYSKVFNKPSDVFAYLGVEL